MALKATIFKADIQIADMDRAHYADYSLTLARHPLRNRRAHDGAPACFFALFAHPALVFARGLSVDDEPGLWQLDLTGRIERWIDVGQPDEKWLRKACGRADEVVVLSYGQDSTCGGTACVRSWRASPAARHRDCARGQWIWRAWPKRSMRLQFSIQDGGVGDQRARQRTNRAQVAAGR